MGCVKPMLTQDSVVMHIIKTLFNKLFSTSAAGLYMILFAAAIGVATFIENDFGTSAAQKVIFKTRWFELLLVLFSITLIVNIFRFRMIQQKKWAILTFHAAMVIILLGAGVTRYIGSEGMMHIREGSASNSYISAESYLLFKARVGGQEFQFDEPVLFASRGNNHFQQTYQLGGKEVQIEVTDFMPNPSEVMVDAPVDGVPILKVVIGGMNGREEYFLRYGEATTIKGTRFTFGATIDSTAFSIRFTNNELTFTAPVPYTQMVMATQTRDSIAPGVVYPLRLRSLYSSGADGFVFGDFNPQGRVDIVSSSPKMLSSSMGGVLVRVSSGGEEQSQYVYGQQGVEGRPRGFSVNGVELAIAYGAKRMELPFSLQLHDFILERYPGTNSASSYASEVTLIDPRTGLNRDQRIYMNHILDHDGYRFFQSSFDQDELGTYLSVNHDAPGTWISYIGYILLTLGMILTFFSPSSRFRKLAEQIKAMRKPRAASILLLVALIGASGHLFAFTPPQQEHTERFGKLLVQDQNGRFKPMNTLSSEVLRKLSRKETYAGATADQVMLSMAINPPDWYQEPMIKLGSHERVHEMLGVNGDFASYNDFFNTDGSYKLKEEIRAAFNAEPRDRGVMEKELIKIDERVNIMNMIFSGQFFRVFPTPGDTSHTWLSPADLHQRHQGHTDDSFMARFYPAYIQTVQGAMQNGDWTLANRLLDELANYQQQLSAGVLPSATQVKAELALNKMDVFSRLSSLYGLLALAFLVLLFTSVFKHELNLIWPIRIATGLLAFGFLMHTIGLGLRWYVSERAPWSNGYESMIYIGWTTVLAGLIFSRKSVGGLTATAALAATIMMVAGLSYLDPEITPLVPVLKSYWLTIHVSLEAGSYGFLMLGAIIGVLNLIFMITLTERNKDKVYRMIREMTMISEMTLIGGLFMISIGTYLGGVWANESWGRYWGWDAKETWALVTILVYAFILHMRFIPGLRGVYAFNTASLFGWASVVMTYFGVNYYLSGLHSYAAGDPVPIPDFVYYTVAALVVISLLAMWRHKKVPQG